jgi:putative chitinase
MKDAQYKLIVDAARQRGATFPTQATWLEFKAAIDAAVNDDTPTIPVPLADEPLQSGLADAAAFFAKLRNSKAMGPTLSAEEVSGCEAILTACSHWRASWTAYGLATAHLETAGTMQPIKEYGGNAYFRRMYDIEGARPAKARELGNLTPGDGVKYAGRGYVQLTGRANYGKATAVVGHDLVSDPDLALRPDIAALIMTQGMETGLFTGKKLADYLPNSIGTLDQFKAARRIINGQDRALEIARTAIEFQNALEAGRWGERP